LDRELNSLKWNVKELERKKKEADARIQTDVEQINELPLENQEVNQETSTKPHHLPGKILLQYFSYSKMKSIKMVLYLITFFFFICFLYICINTKSTAFKLLANILQNRVSLTLHSKEVFNFEYNFIPNQVPNWYTVSYINYRLKNLTAKG